MTSKISPAMAAVLAALPVEWGSYGAPHPNTLRALVRRGLAWLDWSATNGSNGHPPDVRRTVESQAVQLTAMKCNGRLDYESIAGAIAVTRRDDRGRKTYRTRCNRCGAIEDRRRTLDYCPGPAPLTKVPRHAHQKD